MNEQTWGSFTHSTLLPQLPEQWVQWKKLSQNSHSVQTLFWPLHQKGQCLTFETGTHRIVNVEHVVVHVTFLLVAAPDLSTTIGPFSLNRPKRDEPPGPPWSHTSRGADVLPLYLNGIVNSLICTRAPWYHCMCANVHVSIPIPNSCLQP